MKIKPVESDAPPQDEIKNPLRRRQCRDDFLLFCTTYFGDQKYEKGQAENVFSSPVAFHFEFCSDLQKLILSERRKRMARAAPRSGGKTTLGILATIWALLYSHKKLTVWYCENETTAKTRADAVQFQLLNNRLLADDFPEVCGPLKVEGITDWTSNGKQLPNGANTLWKSIDGGNLGTLVEFKRPDFIIIDDPENVSTIKKTSANIQSITAQKRFDRIDKEIGELPEQGKGSFLMLTTIRSRGCLSDQFTDPECKGAWGGKVYKAIEFGPPDKERDVHWNKFLALCGSKESGTPPDDTELCEESIAAASIGLSDKIFSEDLEPKHRRAIRYFVSHKEIMMRGITEFDPVRIPIWDFYWRVGSDDRGREIIWAELQNEPLEDEFTRQMRFSEKNLYTLIERAKPIGDTNGYRNILCSVVVSTDAVHFEVKSCNDDYSRKHLVCCGSRMPDYSLAKQQAIESILDSLRSEWTAIQPKFVAVDIGTESGRDKGEWSEIVAQYCAKHRPWLALQKCHEWDVGISHRAGFKNFCAEKDSNPYGVVKWNATHYKNRLANAYNNPAHPITFFDPGDDDCLWKYIRSQTSEQYTLEFIPDKDATKANVEKWVPVPKYRNMTEFWKTASMVECLADISIACAPRVREARPKPILIDKVRRRI